MENDGPVTNQFESPDIFGVSPESMDVCIDIDSIEVCDASSLSWRGAPLTDIYGGSSPWNVTEFPSVRPGYNHAVLYHIPKNKPSTECNGPPEPQLGKDIWDRNFVRMPFSSQNLYPVEENGNRVVKNRWNMVVESLSKPIKNSYELEAAILHYNSKYEKQWKFRSLHKLFEEYLEEEETDFFFANTLPQMANLAMKLPEIVPCAIPLLRQNQTKSISLSQWQIASLLANAFFCTFPRRNSRKMKSEYCTYPDINFNRLFQSDPDTDVLEKIKCICHYFRRVCTNVPSGVLTFTRHSLETSKCPDWSKSNVYIGSIPLHINAEGTIEDDGIGLLQVDFANKYLGGGVLGCGSVQEEIRFVICPELLISMLFTEVLKPNEALLMIGCERYSDYEGYSYTFKWSGSHNDTTKRDTSGRLKCAIVAIDALQFSDPKHQFKPEFISRELKKAFAGFSIHVDPSEHGNVYPGVATGNWGCGAFCGSPYLKALIQLMACCIARRPMAYYTFNDEVLRDDIIDMYNFLSQSNITVGMLYTYLLQFHKSSASPEQLYPYLMQVHEDSKKVSVEGKQADKEITIAPSTSIKFKNTCAKSFYNMTTDQDKDNACMEKLNLEEIVTDDQMAKNVEVEVENKPLIKRKVNETAQTSSKLDLLENSSNEKNSPVKKKMPLGFFERYTLKTDDNNEKKVENQISNKTTPDDKNKNDTKAKVKISDYFQRLHKH